MEINYRVTEKKMSPKKKFTLNPTFILVALLLLVSVAAVFFYMRYQAVVKDPNAVSEKETKEIAARVYNIIDVPKDETPSVATVTDKDKLKDQEFFKKAENGDKVVIYYSSGIAILYRPSWDKIISVSPINAPAVQPSVSVVPTTPITTPTTTPTTTPRPTTTVKP